MVMFMIKTFQMEKDKKIYWSIGEVSEMFNVPETTLRYWESEFTFINPKKAGRNIRQYSKEDIEDIRLVYHLVKEKGMTLRGAKERLKQGRRGVEASAEVLTSLKNIRSELEKMRRELDEMLRD